MKKLFIVGAIGLFTLGAMGQSHRTQSFLNVQSCNTTNTYALTNLATGLQTYNAVGALWTNLAGTVVRATNGVRTDQLFSDISLWSDRNGLPFAQNLKTLVGTTDTNAPGYVAPARLFIQMHGGSGANAAVTFVFNPVWDGATQPSATSDDWSVALTATTNTPVTLATNIPFYLWPGAKSLRVKTITNGDTDASSQVTITKLSVSGYVP